MRRLIVPITFALLTISISVPITAQDTVSSVLQLVDSEPFMGEELQESEPIILYFDRSLDCATVMPSINITPSIPGNIQCDETTVTFAPSANFERATTYTLQVADTIRGADGSQILESLELQLDTIGFLQVAEVFPAQDSVTTPNSAITVIFNRPVVPLGTVEDTLNLPSPISIFPNVEGQGEWLNTSIYVFEPTGLVGGSNYTVTVDPNLTAVDGAPLDGTFNWSFTTELPQIAEINPPPQSSSVLLDTGIQVRFNQPMNQQDVESNFYLRPSVDLDVPDVTGTFEWAEDGQGFVFTPDENLGMNLIYDAGFEDSMNGGRSLQGASAWSFATVPFPTITGTDPFHEQPNVQPGYGITVFFASPMNEETLRDKIIIEPEPIREPEYFYRPWDESFTVSFPSEPSTEYTVTLLEGMEDVYGNPINQTFQFKFTTTPYSPFLSLQVPGTVGFL